VQSATILLNIFPEICSRNFKLKNEMANKQPNSKPNKRELSWMDQEEMSKSTHIYNYFIELLTSMRTVCHLSQCAAADIIHIDRSQLVKYENKETALTLKAVSLHAQCRLHLFLHSLHNPEALCLP
jgi:DNA-binding transcriptional regulator YiaG